MKNLENRESLSCTFSDRAISTNTFSALFPTCLAPSAIAEVCEVPELVRLEVLEVANLGVGRLVLSQQAFHCLMMHLSDMHWEAHSPELDTRRAGSQM